MDTPMQRWDDDDRELSAAFQAIHQTADGIEDLSLSELRHRIDEVQGFLVQALEPRSGLISDDHVELSRLAAKLDALHERLVYSYFGSAQVRSLRDVLYDLGEVLTRGLAREERQVILAG